MKELTDAEFNTWSSVEEYQKYIEPIMNETKRKNDERLLKEGYIWTATGYKKVN